MKLLLGLALAAVVTVPAGAATRVAPQTNGTSIVQVDERREEFRRHEEMRRREEERRREEYRHREEERRRFGEERRRREEERRHERR